MWDSEVFRIERRVGVGRVGEGEGGTSAVLRPVQKPREGKGSMCDCDDYPPCLVRIALSLRALTFVSRVNPPDTIPGTDLAYLPLQLLISQTLCPRSRIGLENGVGIRSAGGGGGGGMEGGSRSVDPLGSGYVLALLWLAATLTGTWFLTLGL